MPFRTSVCGIGTDPSCMAHVAAIKPDGQARFYLTDQVDSVKVVVDDNGLAVTRMEYLPFGEEWPLSDVLSSAALVRPVRQFSENAADSLEEHLPKFNSQEFDKETGYYYYNARHYDPVVSRFVTADTVIDGEYSTQGWNRFSYVHNNPVMYKDPTGHYKTNQDGSVTFNKKTDTMKGAAKLAGYGNKWENAARVMDIRHKFDDKGRLRAGSKSLVGSTLKKAFFETWIAKGTETYAIGSSVHLPSGDGLETQIIGASIMKFTNKNTGEKFDQKYSMVVMKQHGFSLSALGGSQSITVANRKFLAGTSKEEVAKSWEGDFYSRDVQISYYARSKYNDGGNTETNWKGYSLGISTSWGGLPSLSKTITQTRYKMADDFMNHLKNIKELNNEKRMEHRQEKLNLYIGPKA